MAKTVSPERKIILRNVIVSYPQVFTAKADQKGALKFSSAFLMTEQSQVDLAIAAHIAAAQDGFGPEAVALLRKGKFPTTLTTDPDIIKSKKYPSNVIAYLNARSDNKPQIIDGQKQPITDPKAIYAGCVVNVSLNAFPYNYEGMKKGVSFGLGNIQKVRDGERIDGRLSAEEEFDVELTDDAEAIAALE
jgi:hypothetical protein